MKKNLSEYVTSKERMQRIRDSMLMALEPPFQLIIKFGKKRTLEQNALVWKWMGEAAAHFGDRTANELHAYCKLHFGVPILREGDDFREAYDTVLKPLSYENKLKAMAPPLDFPITRLMSVEQLSRFLDDVYQHLTEQGVNLTIPENA